MDIEQAFQIVGEFGTFQVGVFALIALTSFLSLDAIWANFIVYRPEHFCKIAELQYLPYDLQTEIASPTEWLPGGKTRYSQCEIFNLNYSSYSPNDFLAWNRSAVEACHPGTRKCDSWVYDQSVMVSTAVSAFDLVCNRDYLIDMVSTVTIGGSLFGTLVAGVMADRYGRRLTILSQFLVKIAGCVIAGSIDNFYAFLAGRFIQGFGSSAAYQVVFVALMEFVGPTYRNAVGIGYPIAYSLGYMSLSGVGYFVRDYTYFIYVWTGALVASLLVPLVVKESPRWLLLQGRKAEAIAVLKYMAVVNDRHLPTSDCLEEIEMPVDYHKDEQKLSLFALVKTPRMRVRTLVLCFLWFTSSMIFFALSLGAGNLSGDLFLNSFLLGTVEVPANVFCMWVIEQRWMGRRRASVMFFLVSGLSCMACVPLQVLGSMDLGVTILSLVGKAGSTAAFNLTFMYTTELFPTEIRNLGLGVGNFFGRASGMMAPYAGNSLALVWVALPSLLFGILGIVAGSLSLLLPETLGKALPETITQIEKRRPTQSTSHLIRCHSGAGYQSTEDTGPNELAAQNLEKAHSVCAL